MQLWFKLVWTCSRLWDPQTILRTGPMFEPHRCLVHWSNRLKRWFKAAQTELSFLILYKSQHGPLVNSLSGNTAPRVQNPLHVFCFCTIYSEPRAPPPQIAPSCTWPVFSGSLEQNHSVSQKKRWFIRLLGGHCTGDFFSGSDQWDRRFLIFSDQTGSLVRP